MGMNGTDIGVYVFLFTQKLSEEKTQFSAAGIAKSLKSIAVSVPGEFGTSTSDKSVSASLLKLTELGLVAKLSNTKRTKSSGRPASALYETVDLRTATNSVTERLDVYKKAILGELERFANLEEGVGLIKGPRQGANNDSG